MEESTNPVPQEISTRRIAFRRVLRISFIFVLALILLSITVIWLSTLNTSKTLLPSENPAENLGSAMPDLKTNKKIDLEQIPSELSKTEILLHKDSQLFVTSPLSKEIKQLLPKVDTYALSNDRKKIAYIESYGSDYYTDPVVGEFFILDLESGETKKYITNSDRQRGIFWSPEDTYVLVNSGTGAVGSTVVYSVEDGTSYCTFMNDPVWISDTEAFVDYLDEEVSSRPWESGAGRGIKRMNILTCATDDFLAPTDTRDYSAISMEGDFLAVQETYVQDATDWWNPTGEETPYKSIRFLYDPITREVFSESVLYGVAEATLRDKVKIDLLEKLDFENLRVKEHPFLDNWVLVNVYKGGSVFNSEVYLMNLLGPEIIFVAEGAIATWL